MRKIEINVYKINELAEEMQKKAYEDWLEEDSNYYCGDDNEKTLNKFESIFPINIVDWSYGGCCNYIEFEFIDEADIETMNGIRLLKYLYNNYYHKIFKGKYYSIYSKTDLMEKYPMSKIKSRHSKIIMDNCGTLTGYYMDDVILKPIYDFLKKPSEDITFYDLMEKCLNEWIMGCEEDYNYCQSMEYFIQEMENLDKEFLKDGTLF